MEFVSKIDRSKRRKQTGEDFTPRALVDMMLDKLPPEEFGKISNFLDPCAGNGNIIIPIIERKLAAGLSYIKALETTWALELMQDNVDEMKERIRMLILEKCPEANMDRVNKIINYNIACGDAFKWDFDNWRSTDYQQLELFE